MDLRRADAAREGASAGPGLPAPAGDRLLHHAGSLQGATATGEAARPHRAVRIGVWLDEAGAVRKARWCASSDDAGLRSAAEAACARLEAARPRAEAPAPAGDDDGAAMVAAAVEAALVLALPR